MQTSNASFWLRTFEYGNVVVVSGDIDLAAARQLGESIAQFPAGDVIADFTNVKFMDGSTVRVLLAAQRLLARRGSRLMIRGASGTVMRLMEITGLADVLNFDGNVHSPTRPRPRPNPAPPPKR